MFQKQAIRSLHHGSDCQSLPHALIGFQYKPMPDLPPYSVFCVSALIPESVKKLEKLFQRVEKLFSTR